MPNIEITIKLDNDQLKLIKEFWENYPNTGDSLEEVIVWCAEHYAGSA